MRVDVALEITASGTLPSSRLSSCGVGRDEWALSARHEPGVRVPAGPSVGSAFPALSVVVSSVSSATAGERGGEYSDLPLGSPAVPGSGARAGGHVLGPPFWSFVPSVPVSNNEDVTSSVASMGAAVGVTRSAGAILRASVS